MTAFHFVAGLGSGVLSAVLLQPADLLKTRVQQSGHSSLLATIREISKSSTSIRSFWRGTLPSALRTGFGSAIYFTTLNALRRNVARSNLLASIGALDKNAAQNHSSSLPKLSNLANLTTGALARTGAGFTLPATPGNVWNLQNAGRLFFRLDRHAVRCRACFGSAGIMLYFLSVPPVLLLVTSTFAAGSTSRVSDPERAAFGSRQRHDRRDPVSLPSQAPEARIAPKKIYVAVTCDKQLFSCNGRH